MTIFVESSGAMIEGLLSRDRLDQLPASDLLIFDGACGFCTWSASFAHRAAAQPIHIVPYQWLSDSQLARFGTTRAQCAREVHFIDSRGFSHRGADAANALVQKPYFLRQVLAFIARHEVLLAIEHRCYQWIAAHRVGISRALDTRRHALIDETAA
jgi:predicted DCC family thiol-disulfide oxidoreductase YuxK